MNNLLSISILVLILSIILIIIYMFTYKKILHTISIFLLFSFVIMLGSYLLIDEDENYINDNIKISLCVPCIPKHTMFLEELIKNINEQTRNPDEIIISLTETSKKTARRLEKRLRELTKTKLKIASTEEKLFAGPNRNIAVKNSSGDLVSFMDADDLMHPQRLEFIEKVYKKYKPKAIVHSFNMKSKYKNLDLNPNLINIFERNKKIHLHNGHITTEKSLFDEIKQKDLQRGQDTIFINDILNKYTRSICHINLPLSIYRQINSSVYNPKCPHKMIISFALWGDNDVYNYGLLENILVIPKKYPNALVYVYINTKTVNPKILDALKNFDYVKIFHRENTGGMFWRFEPMFENLNLPILSRDTDSIITDREVVSVCEWLNSGNDFHIMRDHSQGHFSRIMGGMFAVRNNMLLPLRDKFMNYDRNKKYFTDQTFLADVVYPYIRNNVMIHDEHDMFEDEDNLKFSYPMKNNNFIGKIMNKFPNAKEYLNEKNVSLFRKRTEFYKF